MTDRCTCFLLVHWKCERSNVVCGHTEGIQVVQTAWSEESRRPSTESGAEQSGSELDTSKIDTRLWDFSILPIFYHLTILATNFFWPYFTTSKVRFQLYAHDVQSLLLVCLPKTTARS